MAGCHLHGHFSQQEESTLGLARSLLENLAVRFDHDNPDASDQELLDYLKSKSTELRAIKQRLFELERGSQTIANQISAANAALDAGNFTKADDLLAGIEDIQQEERTLREVRRQVQVRAARADSALFQGEYDIAIEHYTKAAEYVLPFNEDEAANQMDQYAGRIYELGRRRQNGKMAGAVLLAARALSLSTGHTSPEDRSQRAYHLALIELSYARTQKEGALDTLAQATSHVEAALEVGSDTIANYNWASCKILQANILLLRGETERRGERYTRAGAAILEDLLSSRKTEGLGLHVCHLHNNLSAAQRQLARTAKDAEAERLRRSAQTNLMRAIEFSSVEGVGDVWLSAQHNLGALLAERAQSMEGETAAFARLQAIAAFQSSIELFPKEAFTTHYGDTQVALGRVLLDHAQEVSADLREIYLLRSISANEVASQIFVEKLNSAKWAETQFHIALAFILHSDMAGVSTARGDLEHALSYLHGAEPHFGDPKMKDYLQRCVAALKYAAEKLSLLNELADADA